jgi:ABC-2 type transport system ATP-binding protein
MEQPETAGGGAAILAEGLTMTFRTPVRNAGVRAAVGALFRPRYTEVTAVRDISFRVEPGEVVGFIGPNGAGKTTTLKMLSGILHPSAGTAEVLGFVPWRRDQRYLRQVAMVRGSRPLNAPIEQTVLDAFRFQQVVYEVPEDAFRRNLDELVQLLGIGRLLERQLRGLSLGERMRAGLGCALLYRPRILYLDEPTIGMDVSGTAEVRGFISRYARQTGATILLTSHYMADVETLCRRIILIDKGHVRYDGDLDGLADSISPYKLLTVSLQRETADQEQDGTSSQCETDWRRFGEVMEARNGKVSLRVKREEAPAVAARLLAELPIADLSVENPPLESVIDRVYREGTVA